MLLSPHVDPRRSTRRPKLLKPNRDRATILETGPGRLRGGRAELRPSPHGPGEGAGDRLRSRPPGRRDHGQLRMAHGRARHRPQEGPQGEGGDRRRGREGRRKGGAKEAHGGDTRTRGGGPHRGDPDQLQDRGAGLLAHEGRVREQEARRDVQQGASGDSLLRPTRARQAQRRPAQVQRGGGGRDADPRLWEDLLDRGRADRDEGDTQRHVQLHTHQDGVGGPPLRRGAGRAQRRRATRRRTRRSTSTATTAP